MLHAGFGLAPAATSAVQDATLWVISGNYGLLVEHGGETFKEEPLFSRDELQHASIEIANNALTGLEQLPNRCILEIEKHAIGIWSFTRHRSFSWVISRTLSR
ncbi:hypothetical protein [Nocardiopsis rhodophaea]|uniref:hypothetical protein n=1 Tax=Nocardiopsis rhodophaea TaxID=280238 RepID=UPI0031DA8D26